MLKGEVELGNIAKRTGSQEMKVSTNVTATNAFREFSRQEYDKDDNDDGKSDNEQEKKSGGPRIKEQIFRSEEKCIAITLRKANATIADIEGYNATKKKVSDATADHSLSYWKRRSLDNKNNLFEKREIRQPKSKKESTDGWDVPPRLQGKIVFSDLRKDHHKEALITELTKREALPATHNPSFTNYLNALKSHEWRLLRDLHKGLPKYEIDKMAKLFDNLSGAEFKIIDNTQN
jgi:hypothetical protein